MSAISDEFPEELTDVKLLIEVKKPTEITDGTGYQVASELIALYYRIGGVVMGLLTNLGDCWVFFWISKTRGGQAIMNYDMMLFPIFERQVDISLRGDWLYYGLRARGILGRGCTRVTMVQGFTSIYPQRPSIARRTPHPRNLSRSSCTLKHWCSVL
ncbi:hypothetical protein P3T76_009942 [Phytophthora citrophthora]|uniref:Uncharacterized protein n=1 Tax=Phytophthora citrophthora TaxID=4793 RepID=A0AAD9LIZ3_9STRA|nr:hypothetical protein P3T76_009942 [Phytophthora citrophthora]